MSGSGGSNTGTGAGSLGPTTPPTGPAGPPRAAVVLTTGVAVAVGLVVALNRPGPLAPPPADEPARTAPNRAAWPSAGRPDPTATTTGAEKAAPAATGAGGAPGVAPVLNPTAGATAAPVLIKHPIGREVERNRLRVAALWHRSVPLDGAPTADPQSVHLAAEVRAVAGNPHGFARGEWVPYLTVRYTLTPTAPGGPARSGLLRPVLADDGPHYGAEVSGLAPGDYRLTLHLEPPPAATVARLTDPVAGVAPWWPPFDATFDWSYRPTDATDPPGTAAPRHAPPRAGAPALVRKASAFTPSRTEHEGIREQGRVVARQGLCFRTPPTQSHLRDIPLLLPSAGAGPAATRPPGPARPSWPARRGRRVGLPAGPSCV